LPSELSAAYLYAQLEKAVEIDNDRLISWYFYYDKLKPLEDRGYLHLPVIPKECAHNAHIFYIKVKDIEERKQLLNYLKRNNILAVFHYIPLHSSKAGIKFGRFHGEDRFTTKESKRLLRLPMYFGLKESDIVKITKSIEKFYGSKS